MLLYTLLIIIILSFIIIKIKYRFWSSQPIFHIYDIRYWLAPPGIIQRNIPKKTKFYDDNIEFHTIDKMTNIESGILYRFVKMHYDYLQNTTYRSSKQDFLRLYTHVSLQNSNKINSCLVSRPLECSIGKNNFVLSYLDLLCIRDEYKHRGLESRQIYTHYIKSRRICNYGIFLYKKQGNRGINVPLTTFNTYSVSAKDWNSPDKNIPVNISVHIIQSSNCELVLGFMKELRNKFDCYIAPDYLQLVAMINNGYIIPTVILDNNTVVAITFFRNPNVSAKDGNIIECIGSYCREDYKEIFKTSFSNSVALIQKIFSFTSIRIENISYNYILLKTILERSVPKGKDVTGYFLYNCAITPIFSPNAFIIN